MTSYCPGPKRDPYYLTTHWENGRRVIDATSTPNPKWSPGAGGFCPHGFQYPHYVAPEADRTATAGATAGNEIKPEQHTGAGVKNGWRLSTSILRAFRYVKDGWRV